MQLRRNAIYNMIIPMVVVILGYTLALGFTTVSKDSEYPYLNKGILLLGFILTSVFVEIVAFLLVRIRLDQYLKKRRALARTLEIILIVIAVLGAIWIRLRAMSILMSVDKIQNDFSYQLALMFGEGGIKDLTYIEHIALFPNDFVYGYMIHAFWGLFGEGARQVIYMNIFLGIASALLMYRVAVRVVGRGAGIVVLLMTLFFPSNVLYTMTPIASHMVSFFFFLAVDIFLVSVKARVKFIQGALRELIFTLFLGLILAILATIHITGVMLLISIVICLVNLKEKMPEIPRNDLPLTTRLMQRGWVRAIIIVVVYIGLRSAFLTNIAYTIDEEVVSGYTAIGYSLLSGMDADQSGESNDEDMSLLLEKYEETGSSEEAQKIAFDQGLARVREMDAKTFVNLVFEKYEEIWGNDEYVVQWNEISQVEDSGNIISLQEISRIMELRKISDYLYIILIFGATICALFMYRHKISCIFVLMLFFIINVIVYSFLDVQNQYHYLVMQLFILFFGAAVHFVFEDKIDHFLFAQEQWIRESRELRQSKLKIEAMEAMEKEAVKRREALMVNTFDLQEAIEKKHIKVSVSEAYREKPLKSERVEENDNDNKKIPDQVLDNANQKGSKRDETKRDGANKNEINKNEKNKDRGEDDHE